MTKSHVLASLNHQFVTIRENFEVKDSRNNFSYRSIFRFIEKRRVFKNGQNRTLHAISIHMRLLALNDSFESSPS